MRFKSVICVVVALAALFVIVSLSGDCSEEADADPATSGSCGDGLTWNYSSNTLTISYSGSGTGAMTDYGSDALVPWNSYRATITSISLPGELTSIGGYAFYSCSGVTGSITIPSGVTTIGNAAFAGCGGSGFSVSADNTKYTSVGGLLYSGNGTTLISCLIGKSGPIAVPSNVTKISNYAFYQCTNIGAVSINHLVTTIGNYAFYGCTGITSLDLFRVSELTTIGSYAFCDCTGLTGSLTFPSKVTTIGNYAFSGCIGLSGLYPSDESSLTTIHSRAFSGCTGLTGSLTILSKVTTIGNYAFSGCINLTGIVDLGSNSISSYGVNPFADTGITGVIIDHGNYTSKDGDHETGVVYDTANKILIGTGGGFSGSIKIPSDIKVISNSAFSGCTGLTSIEFRNKAVMTTIGANAFSGCTGLTGEIDLTSCEHLQFYGARDAFEAPSNPFTGSGVSSVKISNNYFVSDESGIVFKFGQKILIGTGAGYSGEIIIPQSVTRISNYAFLGCKNVTGIVSISDNIIDIGSAAFFDCGGTGFAVGEGNTVYSSVNGLLLSEDGTTLISCLTGKTGSFQIPESVTMISNYAFVNCTGLTGTLTIPDSVTTISWEAFSGCTGITDVKITANATLYSDVFIGCTFDTVTVTGAGDISSTIFDNDNLGSWRLSGMDVGSINTIIINTVQTIDITNICDNDTSLDGKLITISNGSNSTISGHLYEAKGANYELTGADRANKNYRYDGVWYHAYSITYVNGVKEDINPAYYSSDQGMITLGSDSNAWMTFDGWFDNAALTGEAIVNFQSSVSKDLTFYAKWTEIPSNGPKIEIEITGDEGTFQLGEASNRNVEINFSNNAAVEFNASYVGIEEVTARFLIISLEELSSTFEMTLEANGESVKCNKTMKIPVEEREGYDVEIWHVVNGVETDKLVSEFNDGTLTAVSPFSSFYIIKYVLIEDEDDDDEMTNRTIRVVQSESSEIDPDIIAIVVIVIVLLGAMAFLYVKR